MESSKRRTALPEYLLQGKKAPNFISLYRKDFEGFALRVLGDEAEEFYVSQDIVSKTE